MKKRPQLYNQDSFQVIRRELRNNLTQAEALLWTNLKNSRLDGKNFRRQHGIGPYIADFYCSECRLIVELDGARHFDILAQERDNVRTNFLDSVGIRVIRFENREVMENLELVLAAVRHALK